MQKWIYTSVHNLIPDEAELEIVSFWKHEGIDLFADSVLSRFVYIMYMCNSLAEMSLQELSAWHDSVGVGVDFVGDIDAFCL